MLTQVKFISMLSSLLVLLICNMTVSHLSFKNLQWIHLHIKSYYPIKQMQKSL